MGKLGVAPWHACTDAGKPTRRRSCADACRGAVYALLVMVAFFVTPLIPAHAGETLTYYHTDALGSVVAASDASGVMLWEEAYRPFGARMVGNAGSAEHTQAYTGKQRDPRTGLSYFGARYYDEVAGRFVAIDPVGVDEGNVHSFNRYTYANNNPYRFIDLDGRESTGVGAWGGMNAVAVAIQNKRDVAIAIGGLELAAAAVPIGQGVTAGRGIVAAGKKLLSKLTGRGGPKKGLGNPFKDKTPDQIDQMFREKGFEPRGPDPASGKGGYVNRKTGRSYHIDEANSFGEAPHVDVNRLRGYKGPLPKKKLPMLSTPTGGT